MFAEARSVSLLSCEESTYMAVEVGSVNKIILTLNASPETLKALNIKYPVSGNTNNLKTLAAIDNLKYVFRLFSVSAPPMDSSAKGSVIMDNNANVLSIGLGKTLSVFE